MKPKFELKKLDSRADTPRLGTIGAAGFDLQALRIINDDKTISDIASDIELRAGETIKIGTGIAVHMKRKDIAGIIIPRSGRGSKGLVVGNLVGLIDSDYQGELIVCLWNRNKTKTEIIKPKELIAQLVFIPVLQVEFDVVDDFSTESSRGNNGFGSTGTH